MGAKSVAYHAANISKLVPLFQMGGIGGIGGMGQNFTNALSNSMLPSQSLYAMANRYANPMGMYGGMQNSLMQFAQPYTMNRFQPPRADFAAMAKAEQAKEDDRTALMKRLFVMSRLGR